MKRTVVFMTMALLATVMYAQTLDGAIEAAANELSRRLPRGTTVVMVDVQSDSEDLSDYVIDEMNFKLSRIGSLKPVERRQLDAVRQELGLNISGEVDDESSLSIGRLLGSQYLIMGSVQNVARREYRVRFRTVSAETASIGWAFSMNIDRCNVIRELSEAEQENRQRRREAWGNVGRSAGDLGRSFMGVPSRRR